MNRSVKDIIQIYNYLNIYLQNSSVSVFLSEAFLSFFKRLHINVNSLCRSVNSVCKFINLL